MGGSYRRLTGGLKEFGHTGYDLPDTHSTKAFKQFYIEWQKYQRSPKAEQLRNLKQHIEQLITSQEDRELEHAWLTKENAQLHKRCAELEKELRDAPEGRFKIDYYLRVPVVVVIIIALMLTIVWLWLRH